MNKSLETKFFHSLEKRKTNQFCMRPKWSTNIVILNVLPENYMYSLDSS